MEHTICVDYRVLNSITKPDLFPLLRIDDLLDQFGKSRYLTALDLVSGYWQIKVHENSQQITAFITHQGLYQFRVMPFGIMNVHAVFQCLMQKVLSGIQCDNGNKFVSVHLDDVIIFSESLQNHIIHLKAVFNCFRSAGLKLNPKKCKFICDEVECLGHLVTPTGLKPNNRNLKSVKNFPHTDQLEAVETVPWTHFSLSPICFGLCQNHSSVVSTHFSNGQLTVK